MSSQVGALKILMTPNSEMTTSLPMKIACHRGATEFAPENTLASARAAFEQGFDFVEIDVQQTLDDVLVVFHDQTLERTTNARGAVTWNSILRLRQLEVGSHSDPRFSGERIPTMSSILDLAKSYGKELYVELKSVDPALVLQLVQEFDMLDQCFFWSFDHAKCAQLRRMSSEARLMVRRQDFGSLDACLSWNNPAIIEYAMDDDLSELHDCRSAGVTTMVAYMGKNPDVFDEILAARPDIANLHYPNLFRSHYIENS